MKLPKLFRNKAIIDDDSPMEVKDSWALDGSVASSSRGCFVDVHAAAETPFLPFLAHDGCLKPSGTDACTIGNDTPDV